jgi:hypothetical protein
MNPRKIALLAAVFSVLAGSAHAQFWGTTADNEARKQQELLQTQAMNSIGMPAIKNFAERRLLKQIYELRDQNIATYTYLVGLDGKVGQKLCNSVGFGIPAATQFTSPQRVARANETPEHGNVVLPQADPNTLFSPASAEGTWVLCLDPETNKPVPLYVEPRVVVSPFKLVKE